MLFSLQYQGITHAGHAELKVPLTEPDSWTDSLLDCKNCHNYFGESAMKAEERNVPPGIITLLIGFSEEYMCMCENTMWVWQPNPGIDTPNLHHLTLDSILHKALI